MVTDVRYKVDLAVNAKAVGHMYTVCLAVRTPITQNS